MISLDEARKEPVGKERESTALITTIPMSNVGQELNLGAVPTIDLSRSLMIPVDLQVARRV